MPPFSISPIVKRQTQSSTGPYILDDGSSQIQYSSFPSAQVQADCQTTGTCPKSNTVHQTSAAQGSAAFQFYGSSIYIFGVKGPAFGSFTVTIDGAGETTSGQAATISTQALIYSKAGLAANVPHTVVLSNSAGGGLLAFDYASTSPGDEAVDGQNPSPAPVATGTLAGAVTGASVILSGVPIVTQTETALPNGGGYGYGPAPTAVSGGVFGQSDPFSVGQKNTTSNDVPTGTAIGIVFAVLVVIVALFLWYRYYKYRQNGGQGTTWEAFFGKSKYKTEKVVKAEQKDTWKNWPMLRYVPKYTFGDAAEEADKKEKEETEKKKKAAAAKKWGILCSDINKRFLDCT